MLVQAARVSLRDSRARLAHHEERCNDPVYYHTERHLYPELLLSKGVVERFELYLA